MVDLRILAKKIVNDSTLNKKKKREKNIYTSSFVNPTESYLFIWGT